MESESTPTAIRIPSNAPDESSLGTFGDNWPGLQLTPGSPWNPAVPKLTSSSKTKFEDIKLLVENCFTNGVDIRDMLVHAGWITKRNISPVETLHYKEISPERESLKQATYDLLKEASTPNWDGEGALPLTAETVAIAQKLVDRFPSYVASPDVSPTPHGEVDFDWVLSKDVMLTVSIGPSKEVAFAGLFHGARLNGSEPWNGMLPQFVECCFERLYSSLK